MRRIFATSLGILLAGLMSYFMVVRFLGWRDASLVGLHPAEIERIVGPPTCQHMDLNTWFFGISVGGFQVIGVAMEISFGADKDTGKPISTNAAIFPDFVGIRNGCNQWGPPV